MNEYNFERGGQIQQAIILEFEADVFEVLELSVEGTDGRLPNMDIYVLVQYLASQIRRIKSILNPGILSLSSICNTTTSLGYVII